jgi:hypothetical protein
MPNTFTKIASVTVGLLGASSIDFTSIPSTYTDLLIVSSLRNASGGAGAQMKFNTTAGTTRYLEGNGASVSSGTDTAMYAGDLTASTNTANTFSSNSVYIPNYAGSTYKSSSSDAVTENNTSTAYADFYANLWSNTAAITSISIVPNAGSIAQYSTATLYGIKNS